MSTWYHQHVALASLMSSSPLALMLFLTLSHVIMVPIIIMSCASRDTCVGFVRGKLLTQQHEWRLDNIVYPWDQRWEFGHTHIPREGHGWILEYAIYYVGYEYAWEHIYFRKHGVASYKEMPIVCTMIDDDTKRMIILKK